MKSFRSKKIRRICLTFYLVCTLSYNIIVPFSILFVVHFQPIHCASLYASTLSKLEVRYCHCDFWHMPGYTHLSSFNPICLKFCFPKKFPFVIVIVIFGTHEGTHQSSFNPWEFCFHEKFQIKENKKNLPHILSCMYSVV